MRILLWIAILVIGVSSNGCSGSSSAQSGPIVQPVLASGDGVLFVTANTNGEAFFWFYAPETGWEPWFTDGTGSDPIPLGEIIPGTTGADCNWLVTGKQVIAEGSDFYFFADDGVNGCEVWRTDGTSEGTMLFADVISGADGFDVGGDLTIGGNNLYVSGKVSDDPYVVELHVINLD